MDRQELYNMKKAAKIFKTIILPCLTLPLLGGSYEHSTCHEYFWSSVLLSDGRYREREKRDSHFPNNNDPRHVGSI